MSNEEVEQQVWTPERWERLSRRAFVARGIATAGALSLAGGPLARAASARTDHMDASLAPVLSEIAKAEAIPHFAPPGPAFDATSAAGKTVFYMAITFGVQTVQTIYSGVQAAAKAAGLKTLSYNANSEPDLYIVGMEQAINQKVDCIIIESIQNNLINEQIKQANAAKIPIVFGNELYESSPTLAPVQARVAFDYVGGAVLEADYVLADSGGKNINCVVFQANSLRHDQMTAAIRQRFDQYSQGGYKFKVEVVPFADFTTQIPTLVRSLVTADPTINYMIAVIDSIALLVIPALHQAHANQKVKLTTYNGTPSVLTFVKNKDVAIADTGGANTWEGWTYIDQVLRLLTGHAPVPGESKPPNRAFDQKDINSINIKAPEALWYDTEAAYAGFKKLWGLG